MASTNFLRIMFLILCIHGIQSFYPNSPSFKNNINPLRLCGLIPSFIRQISNIRCTHNTKNLHVLHNSSKMATKECQRAFYGESWNCSTNTKYLSKLAARTYRESAYLFTIHSASMAFSLAYACSNGLVNNCKCVEKQIEQTKTFNNGKIVLKGARCFADSIKYGIAESRKIFRKEAHRDVKTLVDEHNKEAGRMAVLYTSFSKGTYCHCHGMSGACSSKKCVKRLPKFSVIADAVKELYNKAIKVGMDNNGVKLLTSQEEERDPTNKDMIYAENSPDFCQKSLLFGSEGTKGRECQLKANEPNSCKKLCCNRGHTTKVEVIKEKCQCKFKYCCQVECESCTKIVTRHYCK